ncbi:protein gp37 [Rhizobium sp. PP-F2F-G38]|nr:protein gp37 [Rhizobium sp. PP-CC-3A-592]PYE33588.1 protein gp37 [Rhizobium sp. PP-WC-1G-195]PYE98154.1 protein gp37 [Rhizobium sp. PP-F2F-G38]TCQ07691.1 protein gp37 [Rhizobium sp. PP-F2F-G36]
MSETSIEWTDATWNPVAGCTILSAGCTNCYAMRMAARLDAMGVEKYRGLTRKTGGRAKWTGKIFLDDAALAIPFGWSRPRSIFVNSMSDLFHPDVPVQFIEKVWSVMGATRRHTFQILTKRPDRMANILSNGFDVLPNVWLGTSVENDEVLGRLDDLRAVPAAIRFVSFEPLIGSVAGGQMSGIDWAIVGGESGPNSRPLDPVWIDEIFDMCFAAKTAFFFKQWGGTNKKAAGRAYRGQTWDEMPALSM